MNKFTLAETMTDVVTLWDLTQDMANILTNLYNNNTVGFKGTNENKDKMYATIGDALHRWAKLNELM
jgi:hypothetical protein